MVERWLKVCFAAFLAQWWPLHAAAQSLTLFETSTTTATRVIDETVFSTTVLTLESCPCPCSTLTPGGLSTYTPPAQPSDTSAPAPTGGFTIQLTLQLDGADSSFFINRDAANLVTGQEGLTFNLINGQIVEQTTGDVLYVSPPSNFGARDVLEKRFRAPINLYIGKNLGADSSGYYLDPDLQLRFQIRVQEIWYILGFAICDFIEDRPNRIAMYDTGDPDFDDEDCTPASAKLVINSIRSSSRTASRTNQISTRSATRSTSGTVTSRPSSISRSSSTQGQSSPSPSPSSELSSSAGDSSSSTSASSSSSSGTSTPSSTFPTTVITAFTTALTTGSSSTTVNKDGPTVTISLFYPYPSSVKLVSNNVTNETASVENTFLNYADASFSIMLGNETSRLAAAQMFILDENNHLMAAITGELPDDTRRSFDTGAAIMVDDPTYAYISTQSGFELIQLGTMGEILDAGGKLASWSVADDWTLTLDTSANVSQSSPALEVCNDDGLFGIVDSSNPPVLCDFLAISTLKMGGQQQTSTRTPTAYLFSYTGENITTESLGEGPTATVLTRFSKVVETRTVPVLSDGSIITTGTGLDDPTATVTIYQVTIEETTSIFSYEPGNTAITLLNTDQPTMTARTLLPWPTPEWIQEPRGFHFAAVSGASNETYTLRAYGVGAQTMNGQPYDRGDFYFTNSTLILARPTSAAQRLASPLYAVYETLDFAESTQPRILFIPSASISDTASVVTFSVTTDLMNSPALTMIWFTSGPSGSFNPTDTIYTGFGPCSAASLISQPQISSNDLVDFQLLALTENTDSGPPPTSDLEVVNPICASIAYNDPDLPAVALLTLQQSQTAGGGRRNLWPRETGWAGPIATTATYGPSTTADESSSPAITEFPGFVYENENPMIPM
ncbi:hypothetical protein Dda_2851 [Drechslerella dactyloides]|uniref:Uncharacterized protein n=1 Tax=Drechslerella dactyloides TaxID=74499 RepID=A0AAD6J088_DREDA|nr:hypothetical protein Dda_2851 [Drechslerella dactyloides]